MTVQFISPREPLVDPHTGLVTRNWFLFFQGLFSMTGTGVPNDEIDTIGTATSSLNDVFLTSIDLVANDFNQTPVAPAPIFFAADDVLPAIGALHDRISTLEKVINDLQQGGIMP